MKIFDYQGNFRGINDFYKKKNETASNPNVENKLPQNDSFEKENISDVAKKIKDSKFTAIGAGIVAGITALAGIKKIFSKPSKANKELAKILDKALENMDLNIKDFQATCKDLYTDAITELNKLPKKKRFTYNSAKVNEKLAPAKTNEEILKAEDELFDNLDKWYIQNRQAIGEPETANSILIANKLSDDIANKHLKILNDNEPNKIINDIPDKLRKGKKADKMTDLFFKEWEKRADRLQKSGKYTNELFLGDMKAYMGDKHSEAGELLQAKFEEQERIIKKVKDRIPPVNLPAEFGKSESEIPEIMPSNIPTSIASNRIVKFIMLPDKTKEDYVNFVKNMGENLNLKDIKILNERLKIRTALSDSEYDKKWYNKLGENTETFGEKIENILEEIYRTPIKDAEKIDSKQAEEMLETLRKKFGCKNIDDMQTKIFMKHLSNPAFLNSGMSKLYETHHEKFTENFSSLILNIERQNKNLFDWGYINENII